jgi:uncharacterized membrane protein YfcA
MLSVSLLALVGGTFLLAGFVKGVVGLGLPTVAIGLLAVAMPPAQAAALLVVPSLVTNLWQLLAGPRFAGLLRRLWPMLAGICFGTLAGSKLLQGAGGPSAVAALGAALILYAVLGLSRLRLHVRPAWEPWLGPVIGAATGLVTAATGVFVVPAVPYLGALGLAKDDLIQALGLSFTVSTIALAAALAHAGMFQVGTGVASLLALGPALAGMALGQWVRDRVSPETFRLCFFVGLLGLGAHLVLGAIV